ncbi:prepilin-type N-terminal cleavage/methylation domain-containing protein [Clostridium paridis]|uniref:Prepilin-type N-terminal cleavage/methylation domain-containing protein n=1 Tax=Clostridium paridis TaxID=2803863 RepID=A0A937K402_9CLOT|nr:prepilin-type N-terminal cleavage/methylation domain-containing protein [Clostridium paridis]
MKKRGFTLIELLCSVAVLMVIISITFVFIKPLVKIINEDKIDEIKVFTEDSICFGKLKSKYTNQYIKVAISDKGISIYDKKGLLIKKYQLPNGYVFKYSNGKNIFLLDPNGEANISTTISVKKGRLEKDVLSITAGSEYINVK